MNQVIRFKQCDGDGSYINHRDYICNVLPFSSLFFLLGLLGEAGSFLLCSSHTQSVNVAGC